MFDGKDQQPVSRGFFSELSKMKPDFKKVDWAKVLPMLSLPAGLFLGWRLSADMDKAPKNKSSDD
ncbi:MAG: hypothetical protein EBU84_00315 [Actinobacteria bacterium]|jgi:hypothetical protein|nr:hypothetical protein [Actinomycetota bacterium]